VGGGGGVSGYGRVWVYWEGGGGGVVFVCVRVCVCVFVFIIGCIMLIGQPQNNVLQNNVLVIWGSTPHAATSVCFVD